MRRFFSRLPRPQNMMTPVRVFDGFCAPWFCLDDVRRRVKGRLNARRDRMFQKAHRTHRAPSISMTAYLPSSNLSQYR